MFESNLVPVVGFHSNGESVRVNFGVAPFAYEVRRLSARIFTTVRIVRLKSANFVVDLQPKMMVVGEHNLKCDCESV